MVDLLQIGRLEQNSLLIHCHYILGQEKKKKEDFFFNTVIKINMCTHNEIMFIT